MKIIEATKKKRFINFIIDFTIIILLNYLCFTLGEMINNYKLSITLSVILNLGAYYISTEYFFGKTLGKFITKTKVVNRDGTKISFRTAVVRYACRWIPFETISLALGSDAKAWHDLISKTYVIEDYS